MKNCRKGFSTEPSDREKMTRGRVPCVVLAYLVRMPRTKPRFAWPRQFTLCSFSTSAQPDPGPSSEEMFLPLERKRIVSAAIQKLTPTLRTAMELREVGDLSIKETAGIMGLSVGTVKARIFRGWEIAVDVEPVCRVFAGVRKAGIDPGQWFPRPS